MLVDPQPEPKQVLATVQHPLQGAGQLLAPRKNLGEASVFPPVFTADCSTAHLGNIAINPAAGFQISDCDGDCWRENRQLSAVSFT